jgi:hypothetical protein
MYGIVPIVEALSRDRLNGMVTALSALFFEKSGIQTDRIDRINGMRTDYRR